MEKLFYIEYGHSQVIQIVIANMLISLTTQLRQLSQRHHLVLKEHLYARLKHPFSLVWAFAIDWMHCICLGIVKSKFQSMLVEKSSRFYVGDQTRLINDRLSSIKPPGSKIGCLPRDISELQNWKATEFKKWLIHYSLVVLHGILDHAYFLQWSLLVSSIGILTKDYISPSELTLADDMLKDFCRLYPILYGGFSCSINFHLVRHLVYYIFRRGPLWAYSCFAFESLNTSRN